MHVVSEYIRRRRAIYPKSYVRHDEPLAEGVLEELLLNAHHAPTHRRTEPWEFHVFVGASRQRLGAFMADYYERHTASGQYDALKHQKQRENPLRAAAVIVIVLRPSGLVPEWEEVAAVAMAVQNMWLTGSAYGLGMYWSTPAAALSDELLQELLGVDAEGERPARCLGLLYIGHHELPDMPAQRSELETKVRWH